MQTIRVEASAESPGTAAKLPLTLRETPAIGDRHDARLEEPVAVSASLNWQS